MARPRCTLDTPGRVAYRCTVKQNPPTATYAKLLGAYLRDVRQEQGLTVRALSARTRGVVSHSTIVRLEAGRAGLFDHIVAALDALGYSLVVTHGQRPPVERVGK